jgi:trigger factor
VELTGGKAEVGNYIQMTYDMEVDGEKVEGISSEGFTIEVGAGNMLKDVDDALIGKAVGETFTVDTVFPEDYEIDATLAGKAVTFTITINKLYEIIYPELDDAFAMKNLGYDTMDEYVESLEATLLENKTVDARYAAGEEIWAKILENSEVIQYPEEKVDELYTMLTDNFAELYGQYGMTMEDALETMGMTQEEYEAAMKESAESAVKEEMVLYTIARENDLELTAEETKSYMDSLLEANSMSADDFKTQYGMTIEEYLDESGILISLLYENVFFFLVDNGVAK